MDIDFDEVLSQVLVLLQRQGRVSYRALKVRLHLNDDLLEAVKDELIYAQQVAKDEDNRVLVWTGETEATPVTTSPPDQPEPQPVVELAQPTPVETRPTKPYTPEAERRQLTVMFCDLVGSTELSGQMDAEDYRAIVRAYQDACGDVIQQFDCYIAQTLGDGLLVYSGYPVAHENDAERAVRVGLGILDAMKALNERLEKEKSIQLAVRVGIHTGPVVVGEVGAGTRQEQLALGGVPNVASRIQGLAEPDTVVISAETYRLTQGFFECESLSEHDLRGVTQPIAVYHVLGDTGIQSRLDVASTRGLTPLVGRESESTLLFERWEQAKDGNGQVVLLSGEAGIGKSRLVQVIKDHVAEGTHTRLECRSSPYYQNTALYPIIDLTQQTLRWALDDTADEKLQKLEQALSQYRLPIEETVPLMAGLLSLSVPEDRYPSLNMMPQRQRQKTLETLVAMLMELAERQPVLFIVEDLHWTDPSTLELLDLLIDQTPTASTYVLLTCRPEFQPSWSHRSYLTEMTVQRLSRDQIERMAEQVAGGKGLPDEIVQQLVDKSDGVPLYVEEMTKAVLESGVLKETDGHYELVGSVASLTIPATLQDSLMSRLDRLVTAKAVAQYASVVGRQFSYELLQAVSQLDEAMLQHELGRLVEAELVYQRGLPPQATYTFKHALIQDTAYESLLRSTRQSYHRRIAEVLEKRFQETAETQPELVAHHYTEGGLVEQAIRYWQRAGERASGRSAHAETIGHLTQGIALLETLPETAERHRRELTMQTTLGLAFLASKGQGSPEVERTYSRARELCLHVGDSPQLFPVLRGLWRFYLVRAELQTTRELGEQLLSLAQRMQDPVFLVEAHYALGMTLFWLGEFVSAHEHMEQGIGLYDPQRQHVHLALYGQDPKVVCLSRAAQVLWYLGYPDQALKRNQEALDLAHELTHPFSLVYALVFAGWLHQCLREGRAAQEQAEAALTLSTEQGLAFWSGQGTTLRGWALAAQGQSEEGMAQLRQGLAAYRTTGAELQVAHWLALLAEAQAQYAEVEESLRVLAETFSRIATTGERYYEPELYRLKGQLLLQQSPDNYTEAETCFHQALDIARNQQAKSWELRAATSLARLWQEQGKRQDAYDLLAPVYNWFTEGFDTADLIDAKTLLDALTEVSC